MRVWGFAQDGKARAGGWLAGAVVVVAEVLVAEGPGAAAVACGEDVAALVGGCFGGELCGHVVGDPLPLEVRKVFRIGMLSLDFALGADDS